LRAQAVRLHFRAALVHARMTEIASSKITHLPAELRWGEVGMMRDVNPVLLRSHFALRADPQSQPDFLTDGASWLVDCDNWAPSASWNVPADATSGIYIAKLVREDSQFPR
jgi:N,N-dimethylformamidase beta subunit-like protein